jgi:hypothetical protein
MKKNIHVYKNEQLRSFFYFVYTSIDTLQVIKGHSVDIGGGSFLHIWGSSGQLSRTDDLRQANGV